MGNIVMTEAGRGGREEKDGQSQDGKVSDLPFLAMREVSVWAGLADSGLSEFYSPLTLCLSNSEYVDFYPIFSA